MSIKVLTIPLDSSSSITSINTGEIKEFTELNPIKRIKTLFETSRKFLERDRRIVLWLDSEKILSKDAFEEYLREEGYTDTEIIDTILRVTERHPMNFAETVVEIFHNIPRVLSGMVIISPPTHHFRWKKGSIYTKGILQRFLEQLMVLRKQCEEIGFIGIISK